MSSVWIDTLKKLAPTVAMAVAGPLGAGAIAAIGGILGLSDATQDTISEVLAAGQLSPEAIGKLKELEMEYKDHEQERGFKYAELAFKDRDSARTANVAGGVQTMLFLLSLVLLVVTLGCEIFVLFHGLPADTPDIVVGRVLGLMDAVTMMVMAYWYGTNQTSAQKTSFSQEVELVRAKSQPSGK